MSELVIPVRAALNAGLNVQALDLARDATGAEGPQAAEIAYLGALACARMDAIDEAEKWLARIDRAPLCDSWLAVEVWSLAGKIAKERFAAERDRSGAAAQAFAREAIDAYGRAFALGGAAYPAVNAATMAMLAGDVATAQSLARKALAALPAAREHWDHASAGEALLILDRADEAGTHYAAAHRAAGTRFGDVASMRRQLLLIGSPAALALAESLPAPRVIAFSGHMIDRPDRRVPRFPPALEGRVAAALRDRIAALGPSIGYSQAACGGDLLFLEAMQAAGAQTQVVLPFNAAAYLDSSVRFAGDAWVRRFEDVLARATRVVVATDEAFLGDDVLFEHAGNLIQGMAFLRARELSTEPLMLTVREPESPVLVGGTAATARHWIERSGRVDVIDLAALRREGARADATRPRQAAAAAPVRAGIDDAAGPAGPQPRSRSLKSLLFADISGFSRMPEQYAPVFAEMFLGTCKRILDALAQKPSVARTLGDGLFLVFDQPSQAATFAIRLQQALARVDWPALGLAAETGARIGLHTGPIFEIHDPVTDRPTCYGTHVNRTARLEPIVQPRNIFVTEEFAASLVAENERRFHCDYIGRMALAKHFGDARLYRLRWSMDD